MKVKLITATPDAEKLVAYVARVSAPANQENTNIEGLLKYCAKHGHWSVFETASATFEIETSLAIAAQILRHKSFNFQQFSQRYAEAIDTYEVSQARRQDTKNRQNSIADVSGTDVLWWAEQQEKLWKESQAVYKEALGRGIAKECARMVLPVQTTTRLYMTGSFRSWIHYLSLRSANGTQKEHADIANAIIREFQKEFPLTHRVIKFTQKSQELLHSLTKDMEI